MNHERLKPTRLCMLFRGENDMVQWSARNQRVKPSRGWGVVA